MKVLMIEHFLPESIYSQELGEKLGKYVDLSIITNKKYVVPHSAGYRCTSIFASEYRSMSKLKASASYLQGILRLFGMIIKGNYDVVHIQTFKKMNAEIFMYQLLKPFIKRLAYTAHNITSHEFNPNEYRLMQRFYKLCDLIITHNEYSRSELMKQYPTIEPSKICVVPHGMYDCYCQPQMWSHNKDKITHFVLFGGLRRYKGVDVLLHAVSLLSNEIRAQCRFVIAGNQHKHIDNTDYVAIAHELGVEDIVDLRIHYINDTELRKIMNEADCCVFPYRSIYGSGALLMAYSFGVPVIASNLEAFIEETDSGKTGFLFDCEKPEALKEAITKFIELDASQIAQYREHIAKLYKEKYNWDLSAQKLVDIYSESLERG